MIKKTIFIFCLLVSLLIKWDISDKAIKESCHTFLRKNPDNNNARMLLAKNYYLNDMLDNAADEYKNLIDRGFGTISIYYELAYSFYKLEKIDEAKEYFHRVISIENNYKNACHFLGRIYHLRQEYENAIIYYDQENRLNPQNASLLANMGKCYYQMKNYPKAYKAFSESYSIEPNDEIGKFINR